eukprot:Clim_evm136s149 gene=Clim_evmTU136s149
MSSAEKDLQARLQQRRQELHNKQVKHVTFAPGTNNPAAMSTVREDMVANAVNFLSNDQVKQSTPQQRVDFLRNKGLNDAEISTAFQRVGEAAPSGLSGGAMVQAPYNASVPQGFPGMQQAPPQVFMQPQEPPRQRTWTDYLIIFAVLGGGAYGFSNFIWPHVKRLFSNEEQINDLKKEIAELKEQSNQNSKAILDLIKEMQEQNATRDQALRDLTNDIQSLKGSTSGIGGLKSEIGSVKSLLLNRKAFPRTGSASGSANSTPTAAERKAPTIPAWQLAASGGSGSGAADEGEGNRLPGTVASPERAESPSYKSSVFPNIPTGTSYYGNGSATVKSVDSDKEDEDPYATTDAPAEEAANDEISAEDAAHDGVSSDPIADGDVPAEEFVYG